MKRSYPSSLVKAREYSRMIIEHAPQHDQRTGQYLFNSLPEEVRARVTGMLWDPFHRDMSQFQLEDWMVSHLIFNDDGTVIGLFNKNDILWERKY